MMDRRLFLTGLAMTPAVSVWPVSRPSDAKGERFFLRAAAATTLLDPLRFSASQLWLYNGQSPGPEIRVRQGERVKVRFINDLQEPSSIHWHGIRIDNAMDGVPGLTQEPVPPGGVFDYDFIAPDAGTFWYHAHNHSWAQVGRGLYGALIVEEAEPTFSSENDLTLLIDDWRLASDGSLQTDFDDYMREKHFGRIGNFITVNGKSVGEKIVVMAGQSQRLRLINTSNARILNLDVSALGAAIVAFDGQPVEPQLPAPKLLTLAPAQRADLTFLPKAGKTATITDADDILGLETSGGKVAGLVHFESRVVGKKVHATPKLPAASIPEPTLQGAKNVTLYMEGGSPSSVGSAIFKGQPADANQLADARQVWKFNGIANLPDKPLFRLRRDQTVVVKIKNDTGFQHAMHVHGHHFRIFEEDGSVGDNFWRDTFLVDVNETSSIAFVADNPGKWLLHCHMLEHAAAGMQTWFEVV